MYKICFYNFRAILPDWSLADYPELVFDRFGDAIRAAERILDSFADRAKETVEGQLVVEDSMNSRVYDIEHRFMGAGYDPASRLFDGEVCVEERVFDDSSCVSHNYLTGHIWIEEVISSPYEF